MQQNSDSSLWEDDRGVAPLIGFILLFAMLIIVFAGYQTTVIPQHNADVEFEHYQTAQDDMTEIRSAIFEARTTGKPQSTTFKLGVNYPPRIISLNPPPAIGTLTTGTKRELSIEGKMGKN